MTHMLVDTSVCVCWTELGGKKSPKKEKVFKFFKRKAKPKVMRLGKFLEKFIEFEKLKRVQTIHNKVVKSKILNSLFLLSGL